MLLFKLFMLRQFNNKEERSDELGTLRLYLHPATTDNSDILKIMKSDSNDHVSVGVQDEPIILPSTKYILEVYDRRKVK